MVSDPGVAALSPPLPQAAASATTDSSNQLERRGMESSCLESVQRCFENVGIQPAGMKRPPCLGAGEPDLGRAEEQGIDLVEVATVPLEDLVKRGTVVPRR